jgi:methylated-DNA-[protein]-cysteine S-methyltransferase
MVLLWHVGARESGDFRTCPISARQWVVPAATIVVMTFLEAVSGGPVLWHRVASPLGELQLVGDGRALSALEMSPRAEPAGGVRDPQAFAEVEAQLEAYFAGELTEFEVPLAPRGSGFQLAVWAALTRIPYGETASYGELAERIGRPSASRAVGMANGRNPISIVVPCHRVIGASGELTGYAGGVERKRFLLELERGA